MSDVTATDIALMREAIALAGEADAPFGAVIVKDGRVLARGRNSGRRLKDPTAHGEMVAIRHCLAEHGPEILRGATIYTSGEPCPMCMGAIAYSRVARVVYGASIEELSNVVGQIKVPAQKSPQRRRSPPSRSQAASWPRMRSSCLTRGHRSKSLRVIRLIRLQPLCIARRVTPANGRIGARAGTAAGGAEGWQRGKTGRVGRSGQRPGGRCRECIEIYWLSNSCLCPAPRWRPESTSSLKRKNPPGMQPSGVVHSGVGGFLTPRPFRPADLEGEGVRRFGLRRP
jgi:tRNA(Arg) A34 adenosine deaminase TadA